MGLLGFRVDDAFFSNSQVHCIVGKKQNRIGILDSVQFFWNNFGRMTLNGEPAGQAGWRAVFPIEKHEFSARRRAALKGGPEQGGPASCTLGRPAQQSEPTGCTKGRAAQQSVLEVCTKRRAAQGGPAGCTSGRAAQQSGLEGCTSGRAAHKYVLTGCRKGRAVRYQADCVKNYYFSQLQTFIALCKMADRSMQGWTALNIIELASFRRS